LLKSRDEAAKAVKDIARRGIMGVLPAEPAALARDRRSPAVLPFSSEIARGEQRQKRDD